jgi:hypothetical protein
MEEREDDGKVTKKTNKKRKYEKDTEAAGKDERAER